MIGDDSTDRLPGFLSQDDIVALNQGSHPAPYDVLGRHVDGSIPWVVTLVEQCLVGQLLEKPTH